MNTVTRFRASARTWPRAVEAAAQASRSPLWLPAWFVFSVGLGMFLGVLFA